MNTKIAPRYIMVMEKSKTGGKLVKETRGGKRHFIFEGRGRGDIDSS